jgi:hypothetical protein
MHDSHHKRKAQPQVKCWQLKWKTAKLQITIKKNEKNKAESLCKLGFLQLSSK